MKHGALTKQMMLIGLGVWVAFATLTVAAAHASLIAHWEFDEASGGTAWDSSIYAHNGTLLNGATWYTSGMMNGAVSLDGSNDYVQVSGVADLKYFGGNMTLSTWVYIDAGETDTGYMISKPWNYNGKYNYWLSLSPDKVGFHLGGASWGTGDIVSPSYPSFQESWHHVAAVVDSSNNMALYVDGALAAAGTHAITSWTGYDQNLPLALGTVFPYGTWNWSFPQYSVDGKLDDTAIWNEALTDAQARSIFTVPASLGLDYSLADVMSLWDLYDSQANGDVKGTPWYTIDSLPGTYEPGDAYIRGGVMYVALSSSAGLSTALIPEPTTFTLAVLGLLSLGFAGRRRRRRS